jgi:hypothetical protein
MKKLLIVLGILARCSYLIQWSRSDYLEFDRARENWHLRCDAYIGDKAAPSARAARARRIVPQP